MPPGRSTPGGVVIMMVDGKGTRGQREGGVMSEDIILYDIEGTARKSGTDQHGCKWVEFEVDYGAEQEDGECRICGKTISSGWICLDGGDEVCDEHVSY